ncbi:hypothetical protein CCUS01_16649 [Colletotrichum cuscutae]|uniref:Uncharacterized protein n=1 Tax=Colletotrichum cuscutae TaxID=1209917 RepID=A0AAI9Y295_9PEZI|nr:hypothetical protein CCUS01_16649 [Colletotrichum cuscutae]
MNPLFHFNSHYKTSNHKALLYSPTRRKALQDLAGTDVDPNLENGTTLLSSGQGECIAVSGKAVFDKGSMAIEKKLELGNNLLEIYSAFFTMIFKSSCCRLCLEARIELERESVNAVETESAYIWDLSLRLVELKKDKFAWVELLLICRRLLSEHVSVLRLSHPYTPTSGNKLHCIKPEKLFPLLDLTRSQPKFTIEKLSSINWVGLFFGWLTVGNTPAL